MCAPCLSVWRRRSVCIRPQLFHSSAAICGRVSPDRQVISQPLNSKQTRFQRTNKQRQMSRHNAALTINIWAWTGKISVTCCKTARSETGQWKEEPVWVRRQKCCTLKAKSWQDLFSYSYASYDKFTVDVCNFFSTFDVSYQNLIYRTIHN